MNKNWNESFLILSKKTKIRDLTKPSSIQGQLWSFKYQHQSEFLRIHMDSYTLRNKLQSLNNNCNYLKHGSQILKQSFKNQTPNMANKNTWHHFYRCWTGHYQPEHCFLYIEIERWHHFLQVHTRALLVQHLLFHTEKGRWHCFILTGSMQWHLENCI